jgi:hypothetical protein
MFSKSWLLLAVARDLEKASKQFVKAVITLKSWLICKSRYK